MRRSVAMDFDGVLFDTTNIYDEGTDFVTACPLGPGATYTYDMPLGKQTGTHWYHSQLSVQYVDGLRGPLIIYGLSASHLREALTHMSPDPLDPHRLLYDVDDESTVT